MKSMDVAAISRPTVIYIFIACAVFYSGYAFNGLDLGLSPLRGWMWIALLAAASVPLNLALLWMEYRIPPLLAWAYCYVIIMLIWAFVSTDPADSIGTIIAFFWFLLTVLVFYALLRTEGIRLVALRAVFAVTVASVVVNIVQASMGTFRPGGLYANPNTSGYALVMGMIVTNSFVPPRYRFLYQMFVFGGVIVTLSRASLILWTISVFLLYIMGSEKQYHNRAVLAGLLILVGLSISPLGEQFVNSFEDSSPDAARILTLGSSEELEEDSRVDLASLAWDEIQRHPLLGQGTGHSIIQLDGVNLGTHNMYLSFMMQFGILGVVILPALSLVLLGRRSPRWKVAIPFTVFLLVAGFFSHTMFDQWHYAVLLALVARMTGTEFESLAGHRSAMQPATPGYALAGSSFSRTHFSS